MLKKSVVSDNHKLCIQPIQTNFIEEGIYILEKNYIFDFSKSSFFIMYLADLYRHIIYLTHYKEGESYV